MRANRALVIEPAQSWERLQAASKEWFFEDLDQQMKENHQRFLEELMLHERQLFINSHPYQRHEGRIDQANGFYRRHLTTRMGPMELKVPRTRTGLFHPQVLPRYKRREKAVDEALKSVFLLGVSTRQAGRALATLIEDAVSASTVSAVAKVLDGLVDQFHRRPLQDTYKYVILDGVSVRIRLVGAVQKRMVLCAYGVNEEGRRELIDYLLVKAESEDTWKTFLLDLYDRGLKGRHLKLVVTDGHKGMPGAIGYVWPRAAHQRCWVHKLRNLSERLKASQSLCLDQARDIYQAAHRQEAIERFRTWKRRWHKEAPGAVRCLEEDLEALLQFFDCPACDRKRLRTTNVIERMFVEVRRRIRTMCAFTTRQSCERILYSVFARLNEYWQLHPL